MAGLPKRSKLSPPLMQAFRAAARAHDARRPLDLRDEAGERIVAGRRGAARVAITEPLLRREVAQDLELLMNTISLDSALDLSAFPEVARSILNFGLPDLTRHSVDDRMLEALARDIELAIHRFEPRLASNTIVVSREGLLEEGALKVRFVVRADLICDPARVPVEFIADVDIDTAKVQIGRR
jgi:type VI secretion system protein ImpF